MLPLLKQYNAKATFFLIGHGLVPELVQGEGHEIGIHSFPLSSVAENKLIMWERATRRIARVRSQRPE